MSSDRCQTDHTIMDYLFVGPAGPAGQPIVFVETPNIHILSHILMFEKKLDPWCFPTPEFKIFKIQKNTFQMLLISCHFNIVSRISAQMKFGEISKKSNILTICNVDVDVVVNRQTSFLLRIGSICPNSMKLAALESSLSIFFDSRKIPNELSLCARY